MPGGNTGLNKNLGSMSNVVKKVENRLCSVWSSKGGIGGPEEVGSSSGWSETMNPPRSGGRKGGGGGGRTGILPLFERSPPPPVVGKREGYQEEVSRVVVATLPVAKGGGRGG